MTDPTAGASTDPAATPESATADPAPVTTPDPSTTTETPPVTGTDSPEAVNNRIVAGIDSTVQQGNRVVVTDPITRTNPLEDIVRRIENHFGNANHIVNDLRALANELESTLNSLKAGL